MILTVLAGGLTLVLMLAAALWLLSPGKVQPLSGPDGEQLANSISEKIFVPINGAQQGMFIKGSDKRHPVLLFLHGGPGMPEYFLTRQYPTGLEEDFVVVWWEQRGAGLSYSPEIQPESLTVEQLVADTIAVTDYLRQRFGVEKIYLMAHSGGSFIGLQAAQRAPDRYDAYIGIGQMTDQLESEQLAYNSLLDAYRQQGDQKMVERLRAAPPTASVPLPDAYLRLRDETMHRAGVGTTRAMKSVITGIFLPSWLHPEYTLQEKINLWRGKALSQRALRDSMFSTDLRAVVPSLDLPVYFLHGRYDYTCSYELAQAYLDQLKAPLKGFYTFENSAHSPLFEEPQRLRQILRQDVLAGKNNLADQP